MESIEGIEYTLPCANTYGSDGHCKNLGRILCHKCHLVHYCGPECQLEHLKDHSRYCNFPMSNYKWYPGWIRQRRAPKFRGPLLDPLGGGKVFWGDIPAIDILQLSRNEGETYDKDLQLLFAASGDLRNAIKTIASIPSSFKNTVSITLNDIDLDIVARNVIMLLIALVVDDIDEAIDCIIHIWYSAFIKQSHMNILANKILPLVDEVNGEMKDRLPEAWIAKTWTFGRRSLRLLLTKGSWTRLRQYFNPPNDLSLEKAKELRISVTYRYDRRDWRERQYVCFKPTHRVCVEQYRLDGLLLPFGSPRDEFTIPNPTIFDNAEAWPLMEFADPRDGWDIADVLAKTQEAADEDLHGRVFYYVRGLLKTFIEKLNTLEVKFQLFNRHAEDLPNYLEDGSFTRIDASNLGDLSLLGFEMALCRLAPLLQRRSTNPHATLIMLFTGTVDGTMGPGEMMKEINFTANILRQYLPPKKSSSEKRILFAEAMAFLCKHDLYFGRYMHACLFDEYAESMGMQMKETNTIVGAWPFRMNKRPGQEGAHKEFIMRLDSAQRGDERYVEWKSAL